ncbi:MAG TPA: hypothetical protein VGC80_16140, partial [Acetobacteraceae bacterium]
AAPAQPQQSAAQQAAAAAAQEKKKLADSMDAVAARWRSEAEKNGWPAHAAVPVDAVAGIAASGAQPHTSASKPPPVRSEKEGSAAPSEDVKRPKPPGAI